MLLRILFYIFLIYLAYKVVFDLVIPLYRTTRKIKRGIREMQERMSQQSGQQQGSNGTSATPEPDKTRAGDYIDFEEVK